MWSSATARRGPARLEPQWMHLPEARWEENRPPPAVMQVWDAIESY